MADRIVLNTISYHGHGAIENIVPELTARGYKKAFVCSDPDLIKFGVTKKVTDLLDAADFAYAVYSEIKPNPTIAERAGRRGSLQGCWGRLHRDHRRRLLHGYRKGHRHHHQQPRVCRCALSGGRGPHQEARCVHHRRAHHRRYCR